MPPNIISRSRNDVIMAFFLVKYKRDNDIEFPSVLKQIRQSGNSKFISFFQTQFKSQAQLTVETFQGAESIILNMPIQ